MLVLNLAGVLPSEAHVFLFFSKEVATCAILSNEADSLANADSNLQKDCLILREADFGTVEEFVTVDSCSDLEKCCSTNSCL